MYPPSFFIGISNAITCGQLFYTTDVQILNFNNQLQLNAECKQLQVKQLPQDGARDKLWRKGEQYVI